MCADLFGRNTHALHLEVTFDAILNAVVMELQRTQGAKVKLTLEIAAEAPGGFAEGEVGVGSRQCQAAKVQSQIYRI